MINIPVQTVDPDLLRYMPHIAQRKANLVHTTVVTSNQTRFSFLRERNNSISIARHCTSTQPTNRSPIFSSRLPKHHEAILDHDASLSQGDSSTSLLSANSHDDSTLDNVHLNNGHKRPLEFVSSEQMLAKRRYPRSVPSKTFLVMLRIVLRQKCPSL